MIGSVRGFSLDNYVTLFTEPALLSMMGGTVVLALGVGLLSTILGSLGAIGSFYSKRGTRLFVELANDIPSDRILRLHIDHSDLWYRQVYLCAACCGTDRTLCSLCIPVCNAETKEYGPCII